VVGVVAALHRLLYGRKNSLLVGADLRGKDKVTLHVELGGTERGGVAALFMLLNGKKKLLLEGGGGGADARARDKVTPAAL